MALANVPPASFNSTAASARFAGKEDPITIRYANNVASATAVAKGQILVTFVEALKAHRYCYAVQAIDNSAFEGLPAPGAYVATITEVANTDGDTSAVYVTWAFGDPADSYAWSADGPPEWTFNAIDVGNVSRPAVP